MMQLIAQQIFTQMDQASAEGRESHGAPADTTLRHRG
jgi:hypothetical protein